jgi:aryl sulfotransferase
MELQDHKRIIWLASYPKSGNTWFRAFLANLLHPMAVPADINELEGGPIASSRQLFDEATGLSSSDLTMDEIEILRPYVYRYIAEKTDDIVFHKIHDAYTRTQEGIPLVPADASKGVLYFVRNPLDVAVSFAHHANSGFPEIARAMADDHYSFCSKTSRLHMQLRQRLLSWSNHINSWVSQSEIPVLVIRYEDMMLNSEETFTKAVAFCGLQYTRDQVCEAISKSSFNELRKQENEKGFRERSPESQVFFRKGRIGSWKEELTQEIADIIVHDHRDMMKRLGYAEEFN